MSMQKMRSYVFLSIGIILVLGFIVFIAQHALYAAKPENWDAAKCRVNLKDDQSEIRAAAANRLGELKDTTAVPVLTELLRDNDIAVRSNAAWALGEIRDAQVLKSFFDVAFWDKDPGVRAEAAKAVGKIQDRTTIIPLFSTASVARQAQPASIHYYQSTRPLVLLLRDKDAQVRKEAAWALGEIADGWAVDDLLVAIRDKNADVRQQCCTALGKIKDPRAVIALRDALKDQDVPTRRKAAEALLAITQKAVEITPELPAK